MTGSSGLSDKGNDNQEGSAKLKSSVSARRARERELERKRARGEISCAECRRLKLKCNKKIPCSSCIRRGCHTICPNGLLTTGQGSRFVLANTDKLHGKLLQMSQRIRQLEDALQIAQASISKSPHPLLSEELLTIKSGVDGLANEDSEKEKEVEAVDEDEELAIALGTLTVSECGATRFIGRVGAETLLINEPFEETGEASHDNASTDSELEGNLPGVLVDAANEFLIPYRHIPREQLLRLINQHLPTYERASALAEAYLENVAWLPRPIQREQIVENLIPLLYKGKRPQLSAPVDENGQYTGMHAMHNLALAMAVFACGAAGDLTLPPNNKEGRLYHTLAMAALSAHSITGPGGASLETVQTVILIAQYDFFSGAKSTLESAWKVISFGLIIAASIGLHRDPAYWNMEPKYIERRRSVFWEVFSLDKFKSLGTGRPSIFHMQEIDCEFPKDTEAYIDENGKQRDGPTRWRFRFVKEVLGPLSEHLCMTKPIKYSEILDWDRRIREFEDPAIPPSFKDPGSMANARLRLWSLQKEIGLLSIHRNFFARAMIKYPQNPLRSPFAPSFLATYASSIKFIRNCRTGFDQNPGMMVRLWPIWTHCLTSGVIVGSIASNTSQPALATAAFHELNTSIKILEDASTHPVCRQGLPILLRLRERARVALQNLANQAELPPGTVVPKVEQDETDELAILRGTARLVHRKRPHSRNVCPSTRYSPSDSHSTKSDGTSNNSSPSPVLSVQSAAPVAQSQQRMTSDRALFDSPRTNASTTLPGQTELSIQSASPYVTQDIASIFDSIYSTPSNTFSSTSMSTTPDVDTFMYGQQSQSLPQQPPQSAFGPGSSQIPRPRDTGPSSAMPSNAWMAEAAQLESIIAGTYGGTLGRFDVAPSVEMTPPSYDMLWLSGNEPGAPSEFGGDTAQFMEDWRLQAAIEGSNYPAEPEPEPDVKMLF